MIVAIASIFMRITDECVETTGWQPLRLMLVAVSIYASSLHHGTPAIRADFQDDRAKRCNMIELTVPLSLPLFQVYLGDPHSDPPEWVQKGFARLPAIKLARTRATAEAVVLQQQQQAAELLQQQRDAWKRGLVELHRATVQTDAQCAAILSELREAAVELAHAIASKLVFQQLNSGTFPTERLVAEVLSRLNTHEPATVRLHPDDLAALRSGGEVEGILDSEREIRLVADPRLARGDCKAAAGEITVVYELRRQIEEIRREILSTVNGHVESGP